MSDDEADHIYAVTMMMMNAQIFLDQDLTYAVLVEASDGKIHFASNTKSWPDGRRLLERALAGVVWPDAVS